MRRHSGALRRLGRVFHGRGWSLGTSSNYSVRLCSDPLELLITASGKDKGALLRHDFVVVDGEGRPTTTDAPRPSAETLLHVELCRLPHVGAVLHTHSVWSTLLSHEHASEGCLAIGDFEMLKGLAGVTTHEHLTRIAIFENTQDIAALARELRQRLAAADPLLTHAFLIRRHGLYTWGQDLDDARRHVEVLEFLFECLGRQRGASSWQ